MAGVQFEDVFQLGTRGRDLPRLKGQVRQFEEQVYVSRVLS